MPRLFVYGSLKRGCSLNRAFMKRAIFLREARAKGYTLYLSEDGYPLMVKRKKEKDHRVFGELWDVPEEDMKAIESMERKDGYILVEVELDDGEKALAFVYPRTRLRGEKHIGSVWNEKIHRLRNE